MPGVWVARPGRLPPPTFCMAAFVPGAHALRAHHNHVKWFRKATNPASGTLRMRPMVPPPSLPVLDHCATSSGKHWDSGPLRVQSGLADC